MKVARISDALAEAGIIKVSGARVAGKTKTNPRYWLLGSGKRGQGKADGIDAIKVKHFDRSLLGLEQKQV
jgi:hypothetical protein